MSYFSSVFGVLEFKLHRNLLECWVVFNDDPFDKFKLIHHVFHCIDVLLSFENENLIRFVLIHNQFFSTDTG
jgi:hypothetical protein